MKYNLLIAHPDDEVIFGFGVLKNAKRIICCSSDLNNPERQWCKDRKKALYEIAELVGAEVFCFDYNSEFYRAETRNGTLFDMLANIKSKVIELCPVDEFLFTHNTWGEYGHLDHILVNQIARTIDRDVISTNIMLNAGWFDVMRFSHMIKKRIYNDLEFYYKCKSIYEKYNAWTWSKPAINECELIHVK